MPTTSCCCSTRSSRPGTCAEAAIPTTAGATSSSCTPAGRRALERAERAQETIEDELLAPLSREERTTLHALLSRALAAANQPAGTGYLSPDLRLPA